MVSKAPVTTHTIDSPSLSEAYDALTKAMSLKATVIMVGSCTVAYVGRASSTLDLGQRIVMLKSDGSLLVHRGWGYDAVNWQPPGCSIKIQYEEGLAIRAVRRSPREVLNIQFKEISMVSYFTLRDDAKFEMYLTEESLYEAISLRPDLIEKGLSIVSAQRKAGKGTADFTGRDSRGNYVIVEVKKEAADQSAVKQLYKYIAEVKGPSSSIRGILAAPKITLSALRMLKNLGLEFRRLDLRECAKVLETRPSLVDQTLDAHLL